MRYQLSAVPHSVAWPADTRQTIDVEVNQFSGSLVFVENHRGRRIELTQTVQSGPAQGAPHRSSTRLQFTGDTPAVAALPGYFKNLFQ
jgi:hypothetical protein